MKSKINPPEKFVTFKSRSSATPSFTTKSKFHIQPLSCCCVYVSTIFWLNQWSFVMWYTRPIPSTRRVFVCERTSEWKSANSTYLGIPSPILPIQHASNTNTYHPCVSHINTHQTTYTHTGPCIRALTHTHNHSWTLTTHTLPHNTKPEKLWNICRWPTSGIGTWSHAKKKENKINNTTIYVWRNSTATPCTRVVCTRVYTA